MSVSLAALPPGPGDCGGLLPPPPSLALRVLLLYLLFSSTRFLSPPFSCSVKVPSTSAQGVALISPMILFRCLKFRVGPPFSFHEAFYFLKLIAFCDWARPLTQGNESYVVQVSRNSRFRKNDFSFSTKVYAHDMKVQFERPHLESNCAHVSSTFHLTQIKLLVTALKIQDTNASPRSKRPCEVKR